MRMIRIIFDLWNNVNMSEGYKGKTEGWKERKKVERVRWRETPRTASPFPDTVAEKDGRREGNATMR